ncbi:MAG: hypothetical protein OXC92_00825 [Flavobacteriaceae bacterium]|nr:hypothetical protein [Flavobacteriaceae bacterium]
MKFSYLGFFLIIFNSLIAWAQSQRTQYSIDAELSIDEYHVSVAQIISFKNPTNEETDIFYLLDWNNAYANSQTPLSDHLAEDFNRRFYLSGNHAKGNTQVQSIRFKDQSLAYQRLSKQPDIIQIVTPYSIKPKESIELTLHYKIKIPSNRFTGIGVKNGESIILRNWYIRLAPFIDNQWLLHSELGLSDNSHLPSDYRIDWRIPNGMHFYSNLINESPVVGKSHKDILYAGQNLTRADFVFSYQKQFEKFDLRNGRIIETDIIPSTLNLDHLYEMINKIDDFIIEKTAMHSHPKQMVLSLDHDKNPFIGLNLLPRWLDLYPDGFRFELEYLIASLRGYLHNLPIDKRKNHWIINGLQTYFVIQYVEEFYPDLKFLGNISNLKLIQSYQWSNLNFNESYLFFIQASEASQDFQPDGLSKEKLTRYNHQTISPYRVGTGLVYLENYFNENIPEVDFEQVIKDYSHSMFYEFTNDETNDFSSFFQKSTTLDLSWFFDTYLNGAENIDVSIKSFQKKEHLYQIELDEKNGKSLPVEVVFYDDNREKIDSRWIDLKKGETTRFNWPINQSAYVAVNPKLTLADSNRKNNWHITSQNMDVKPFKLQFGFDIDNPTRTQLFYYPWTKYNTYDGITIGTRLFNIQEKKQTIRFDFEPLYSLKEDTFVGDAKFSINLYKDNLSKYREQYSFNFNTFHYDAGLRYSLFRPSIRWYFRPSDLRSRKNHLAEIALYSVRFDQSEVSSELPNYDVVSLRHLFSNKEAINYFTFDTGLELSKDFSKLSWTLDYRRLQHNGSQIGARIFIGKFLSNPLKDDYFHYRISKPKDYLFRYRVFGRSDTTGIFSQQFINLDGAFKTDFTDGISDNFMAATNLYFGVWKFIELYGDFALLKSKELSAKTFWGGGIRLNIVPDYLEFFFPLVAKNQSPINDHGYFRNIRFTFYIHPNVFRELFSKRWE